jgi:sialic acid synthase SpsE
MFCEYIASKGVPTIVSTGMTNYHQQAIVWDIFQKAKCPMMFLHCTSAYPSPLEDKNLRCIPLMKEMFGCDIGFSGHAIGIEGTLGAVALGANVIEKHVTLSRKMSGPDHAAALEFAELADLVERSRNMVVALGTGRKSFLDSEKTLHGVLCRKIVLKKNINKGSKITKDDLTTFVTNKEGGVLPENYYEVVGATAQKDLVKDQILEIVDYK